jgi:hypothetical protein
MLQRCYASNNLRKTSNLSSRNDIFKVRYPIDFDVLTNKIKPFYEQLPQHKDTEIGPFYEDRINELIFNSMNLFNLYITHHQTLFIKENNLVHCDIINYIVPSYLDQECYKLDYMYNVNQYYITVQIEIPRRMGAAKFIMYPDIEQAIHKLKLLLSSLEIIIDGRDISIQFDH